MPSGFLDVTPGAVSEAQRNAILARKLSTERVQPRHNNLPHLRQFTVHQVENQATLYYVLNQLQGTAQPYVAYTPEVLFGRSPPNWDNELPDWSVLPPPKSIAEPFEIPEVP